jgi:hypothetical protein
MDQKNNPVKNGGFQMTVRIYFTNGDYEIEYRVSEYRLDRIVANPFVRSIEIINNKGVK